MIEERQLTIEEMGAMEGIHLGLPPDATQVEVAEAVRLSSEEQQRKQAYEAVFSAGFASDYARMLVVGLFKKERLYRNEYPTWEEYCERKLQKTARRIDQLIKAAEVVQNIKEALEENHGSGDVPAEAAEENHGSVLALPNERQARELAQLETPAEQAEVWVDVVSRGEPVTAQVVEAAVEAFQAEKVYPFLGGSDWSDDAVRQCAEYLDNRSEEERVVLSSLFSAPDNNAESIQRQLANYEAAPPELQEKVRSLWQSDQPADREWVIQRLDAEAPRPIDKRKIPLKYADRYVKEAIDAYPGDAATTKLREARTAIRDVLLDIRRKEGVRNDDSEELDPIPDDEGADRGDVPAVV